MSIESGGGERKNEKVFSLGKTFPSEKMPGAVEMYWAFTHPLRPPRKKSIKVL